MFTQSYFHLSTRLKHTPHEFCVDIPTDLSIGSISEAREQLLIHLIINTAHRAFSDTQG